MEMDYTPQFDGYSGVEIVVDKDNTYFSGDRTGRVLTIQNPWGTKAQADNIIEKIRGYQYQPFTATGALLDPAAEIGDGVSARAFYAGLHKIDRTYNSTTPSDIEAPQDEEVDHEYPFEPQSERDITRRFTAVESELSLQSGEIAAKVSETGGNGASFGWSLTVDGFILRSQNKDVFKVNSTGAYVDGVIQATSGTIGKFVIGDKAIYNNIPDFDNEGGLTSGVYLGTDGFRLGNNFSVNPQGTVHMSGTLYIGGNSIDAAALRSGAQSAYTNGQTWSTGSGYGFNYNNATKASGGVYPSHFQANTLKCTYLSTTSIGCSGRIECGSLYVNGHQIT